MRRLLNACMYIGLCKWVCVCVCMCVYVCVCVWDISIALNDAFPLVLVWERRVHSGDIIKHLYILSHTPASTYII